MTLLLQSISEFIHKHLLLSCVRLVAHLDKCTLRLLAENERVASFSPGLRDRLTQAQDRSTATVNTLVLYCTGVSTFIS